MDNLFEQERKGSQIGPFFILELLGTGGMGAVYLALQKAPHRKVALKILHKTSLKKKILIQRFLKEVEITSTLNHPHIVKTYLAGMENHVPYLAMEYIEGMEFTSYINIHKPSLNEKLSIIIKVAKALHYAHTKGVTHRDIKPSNIMINTEKQPIVMDFGIAKSNRVFDKKLTLTGEVIGTPQYMSPEQVQGKRKLDGRSDVYSLGSVLYEMLTGRLPFEGEGISIFYKIISKIPDMPRSLNPDITKDLEAIILKSIEKNKNNRYQSALLFAQDLENYLYQNKISAAQKYHSRRFRLQLLRYKKSILALFTLIVIGGLTLSFFVYKSKKMKVPSLIQLEEQVRSNRGNISFAIKYIKFCQKIESYREIVNIFDYISQKNMTPFLIESKAYAHFILNEYKEALELFIQLDSPSKFIKTAIAKCYFCMKQYKKVIELFHERSPVNKYEHFYYGASLVERYFASLKETGYLVKIKTLIDKKETIAVLEKAKHHIKKALAGLTPKEHALKKSVEIYFHYSNICNLDTISEKILKQYPRNLVANRVLAIYYFCREKYVLSAKFISKCIKLVPWNSQYYHLLAQVQLKQKVQTDSVYHNCLKALEINSQNTTPMNTLASLILRSKNVRKTSLTYYYFINYILNEKFEIQVKLWEDEILRLSQKYLRIEKRETTKKDSFKKGVQRLLSIFTQENISKVRKKIVSTFLRKKSIRDEVLKKLKKIKKGKKGKIRRRIIVLIKQIKRDKEQEELQFIKHFIVQFIVGRRNEVIKRINTPRGKEYLKTFICENNGKNNLLKYWSAIVLIKTNDEDVFQFIREKCSQKNTNITERAIYMAALFYLGFENECIYRSKKQDKLVISKEDTNEKLSFSFSKNELFSIEEGALQIFLHNLGKYLPKQQLEMLIHKNISGKVNIAAARALFQKNIPHYLVKFLSSSQKLLKTYAYCWFQTKKIKYLKDYFPIIIAGLSDTDIRVRIATLKTLKNYGMRRKERALQLAPLREKILQTLYEKKIREDKNEMVKMHLINTLSQLQAYQAEDLKMIDSNDVISMSISTLKLIYTSQQEHLNNLQYYFMKQLSQIQHHTALQGLMLYAMGRFGKKDVGLNHRMRRMIAALLIKKLREDDLNNKTLASYSAMMLGNKNNKFLRSLEEEFNTLKDTKVRSALHGSILYLSSMFSPKKEREYFRRAKNLKEHKYLASYGYLYHFDKWYTEDWRQDWIAGIDKFEREVLTLRYVEHTINSLLHQNFQAVSLKIELDHVRRYFKRQIAARKVTNRAIFSLPAHLRKPYLFQLQKYNKEFYRKQSKGGKKDVDMGIVWTRKMYTLLIKVLVHRNVLQFRKQYANEYPQINTYMKKLLKQMTFLSQIQNFHFGSLLQLYFMTTLSYEIATIITNIDKALSIEKRGYYFFLKGYLLCYIGEYEKARLSLEKARIREPESILYRYTHAKILFSQKKYPKSQKILENIIKENVLWDRVFELQGKIYLRQFRKTHFSKTRKKAFTKALHFFQKQYINRPNGFALIHIAQIYLENNKLSKVRKLLTRIKSCIIKRYKKLEQTRKKARGIHRRKSVELQKMIVEYYFICLRLACIDKHFDSKLCQSFFLEAKRSYFSYFLYCDYNPFTIKNLASFPSHCIPRQFQRILKLIPYDHKIIFNIYK